MLCFLSLGKAIKQRQVIYSRLFFFFSGRDNKTSSVLAKSMTLSVSGSSSGTSAGEDSPKNYSRTLWFHISRLKTSKAAVGFCGPEFHLGK